MKPLTNKAKQLRKDATDTENILWNHLKAKRLNGLKFRRQQPIGKYIVDFVCLEKKIVVELDGGQHFDQIERDKKRDQWLKEQGYNVIRFWNHEFLENQTEALELIVNCCQGHPTPNPFPSREGEI